MLSSRLLRVSLHVSQLRPSHNIAQVLTAILYHGAHPSGDIMHRTWSLIWRLFVCIMFYRGAGLAWDVSAFLSGFINTEPLLKDIIDCKVDARVARTKTRPIPSGAISMAGAVSFCVILTMFTGVLFVNMLPPAV
jgi:4-hydroxybenzoate polyprenyltransferase